MNCQKELFSLEPGHHYLNCAYMSPLLKTAVEAGKNGIEQKINPFHVQVDDFFDPPAKLEQTFARLINADQPDRIVIIPSVSYGISTVVNNVDLKPGESVLLVDEAFPSQYYPWERKAKLTGASIQVIQPQGAFRNFTDTWNEAVLEAIDSSVKVVCLSHVHWANGTVFDLKRIRERTREVGALMIIDGTQSVGAFPFDVESIQPDALICAGYKFLMGPYSMGLAYFGEAFDQGVPLEENWINRKDSHRFERLVNYQAEYRPAAQRYAVGEHSNFIMVPMLQQALDQILEWGVDNIQDYCSSLLSGRIEQLLDHGYQLAVPEQRASQLFGIGLPEEASPEALLQKLRDDRVYVSVRGSSIRVSPHVYNTTDDVDALIHALTT